MARKPVLILFLLAIPFTLLLAEFAAFGRSRSIPAVKRLPMRVMRADNYSSEGDRFVGCLEEQQGHPINVVENASDSVRLEGASPIRVTTEFQTTDQTDKILESSIVRICAAAASNPASVSNRVTLERAASVPDNSTIGGRLFFARFFPGLALFGGLFLSQAMASLVWRDQESQAQRRLLTLPVRPFSMVLGPLLFLTAGAAAALMLILAVCAFAAKPQALASLSFWALAIGFAFCAAGLELTIGLIVRSHRAAQAMSASVNMMLAFFGGGFVPLALYPPFLRTLAYALPNGAGQAGLTQLLSGAVNGSDLLWRVSTVWIWAAGLVVAAVVLQNRRMLI